MYVLLIAEENGIPKASLKADMFLNMNEMYLMFLEEARKEITTANQININSR